MDIRARYAQLRDELRRGEIRRFDFYIGALVLGVSIVIIETTYKAIRREQEQRARRIASQKIVDQLELDMEEEDHDR